MNDKRPARIRFLGKPSIAATAPLLFSATLAAALASAETTPAESASADLVQSRTVSPGALDRFVSVGGRCQTFSWTLVADATGFEISIFAVDPSSGELSGNGRTWYVEGAATSWTPSAEDCLEPGESYAWFVRSRRLQGLSEWSSPRLLQVTRAPTLEEVAAARDVLSRFVEAAGDTVLVDGSDSSESRVRLPDARATLPSPSVDPSSSRRLTTVSTSASLAGVAALRGHSTQVSGDANGVVGISSSPEGAGVVAAGAGNGVDIVLDGSTSSQSDTWLSQSGIDRPSTGPETFTIENSAGGGFALSVAGSVAADSFTGDGSGLTGVSVDDIDCVECVGPGEVATDAIGGAQIANLSVTGDHVASRTLVAANVAFNSLTFNELATNSVGRSEISTAAVGTDEIATNAVGSLEIASSAVGSSEIASGAVGASELATIKVVSIECEGSCGETATTLGLMCGSGYTAIAVDCDQVDFDSGGFSCGGNNRCVSRFISDSDPIGNYCLDQNGMDAQVYCLRD